MWKLDRSKMSSITTDNASNNIKAFKQCTWIPCFGHNLDLAVQDQVNSRLVRLRRLISAFNRSTKRKRQLEKQQAEQGLPLHQPIHDEPTRWGSTYDMV